IKPLNSSLIHFIYLLIYKLKSQKVSTIKKNHEDQKSSWPHQLQKLLKLCVIIAFLHIVRQGERTKKRFR
ncbi:MAG TPA: hypothetical protein DDX85_02280, partial [Nitrospiraceae bacterium]|nr:hypothetical protein [Nitrospiraceae bacterium]